MVMPPAMTVNDWFNAWALVVEEITIGLNILSPRRSDFRNHARMIMYHGVALISAPWCENKVASFCIRRKWWRIMRFSDSLVVV